MPRARRNQIQGLDIGILVILTIWGLLILYPFYNALLVSLVDQATYMRTPFMLWPSNVTTNAYEYILSSASLMNGYMVTVFITVVGVAYSMFLTVPLSYALAKRHFPGRGLILNLIIFTMYFHGGLIPYYMLMRSIGMMNSVWSMILPIGVSTFNFLITRNYFRTIPASLEESAKIDGANEVFILLRIIIPLSAPVLLVIALFYAVASWNEWFNAMLFIRDANKRPLQLALRYIITSMSMEESDIPESVKRGAFPDGVKMAAIFVSTVPIMCLYPFVQKHFVKGIMLGAIKS